MKATVLFLDRSGLSLYCQGEKAARNLGFSPEIVVDLEVKNSEGLDNQIQAFIADNKIVFAPLIVVLSTKILFQQILEVKPGSDQADEVEKFVESVPFEYSHHRVYSVGKKQVLVVANSDYYETVVAAFVKRGFTLVSVVPQTVLDFGAKETEFSLKTAQSLCDKTPFLVANDFSPSQGIAEAPETKRDLFLRFNQRFLVLCAIFGVLILILIITIFFALRRPALKKSVAPVVSVVSPVKPVEIALKATSSAILKVKIINASGTNGLGAATAKDLGYKEASLETAPTLMPTTAVGYKKEVLPEKLNTIVTNLKLKFKTVLTRELTDGEFDVVVTLGTPLDKNLK